MRSVLLVIASLPVVMAPGTAEGQRSGWVFGAGAMGTASDLIREAGDVSARLPVSWRLTLGHEWELPGDRRVDLSVAASNGYYMIVERPGPNGFGRSIGKTARPGLVHWMLGVAPVSPAMDLQPRLVAGLAQYLWGPLRACFLVSTCGQPKFSGTHAGFLYGAVVRWRPDDSRLAVELTHTIARSIERPQKDWAIGVVVLPRASRREP